MKLKVQAQHLQLGDIVGSGDTVGSVTINSTQWPSNKVRVALESRTGGIRSVLWGKYTMIGVERGS